MTKAIKQAPAREVMRSEIHFASYNPRKLTEDARKRLKANLKRVGLAGGHRVERRDGQPRVRASEALYP